MNNFVPGIYKHYKGGLYAALLLVTHHETRQPMVVYWSLETGEPNVRPLKGWGLEGSERYDVGVDHPCDPDGWLDPVKGEKVYFGREGEPSFARKTEPFEEPRFVLVQTFDDRLLASLTSFLTELKNYVDFLKNSVKP